MSTRSLARTSEFLPSLFDDFFRPWNEWFDNGGVNSRILNVPAVNISENKDDYILSFAIPGMKKDDFHINLEGNILSVSCEKEEKKDEGDAKFTRKEYNYSSFSRNFSLPDEVNKEKIDAKYEDGVLKLSLPKREEAKRLTASKHIAVK